jgi:hypothetical protein
MFDTHMPQGSKHLRQIFIEHNQRLITTNRRIPNFESLSSKLLRASPVFSAVEY